MKSYSVQKPFFDYFKIERKGEKEGFNRKISYADLYDSIKESLKSLLVARVKHIPSAADYKVTRDSILNYGITDFMDIRFGTKSGGKALCQQIKKAIENYEKRLVNVDVEIKADDDCYGVISLKIVADLNYENINQTVIYDSYYDAATDRINIGALKIG